MRLHPANPPGFGLHDLRHCGDILGVIQGVAAMKAASRLKAGAVPEVISSHGAGAAGRPDRILGLSRP